MKRPAHSLYLALYSKLFKGWGRGFGVVFLALALFGHRAEAFTLIGPYENWMLPTNSFQLPGDIGGPKNLGDEYRWNIPVITYAFDDNFVSYFGQSGITAVNDAMAVLNNLTPTSVTDPNSFPPEVTQINYAAQAQGLIDLKSSALALVLEQLGLGQPTRHAFCVRSFTFFDNQFEVQVLHRNFDPFGAGAVSNVNDTVYSYHVEQFGRIDAVEFPVNPLASVATAVADRALQPGAFYTGLTRDDVGGLCYLLRPNNINYEILLPDVHEVPDKPGGFVGTTLRAGVDKIFFLQLDYNTTLGQLVSTYTNQYNDYYVTNAQFAAQLVERIATRPDILFSASAPAAGPAPSPLYTRTGTDAWTATAPPGVPPGFPTPGVIKPPVTITFQKILPRIYTTDASAAGTPDLRLNGWGSFDGTANPPIAFPVGGGGGGDLKVNLYLHPPNDYTATASFNWQLAVPPGGHAALEMSADLKTWVPLTVVTNTGHTIEWDHTRLADRHYYRIVPQ